MRGEPIAFVGAELVRISDHIPGTGDLGKPWRKRHGIAILTHASTLAAGGYPQKLRAVIPRIPLTPFVALDKLERSAVGQGPQGRVGFVRVGLWGGCYGMRS